MLLGAFTPGELSFNFADMDVRMTSVIEPRVSGFCYMQQLLSTIVFMPAFCQHNAFARPRMFQHRATLQ